MRHRRRYHQVELAVRRVEKRDTDAMTQALVYETHCLRWGLSKYPCVRGCRVRGRCRRARSRYLCGRRLFGLRWRRYSLVRGPDCGKHHHH